MAVLEPLKVVIENYPEGQVEELDAVNNPRGRPTAGTRKVPFGRCSTSSATTSWRTRRRTSPPRRRAARCGCATATSSRCSEVEKDASGAGSCGSTARRSPTRGRRRRAPRGSKVKGTMHWVSAAHAVPAEVRLYERLFSVAAPDREDGDFLSFLNPHSKTVVSAMLEPALADLAAGTHVQFERQGYFFEQSHRTWRARGGRQARVQQGGRAARFVDERAARRGQGRGRGGHGTGDEGEGREHAAGQAVEGGDRGATLGRRPGAARALRGPQGAAGAGRGRGRAHHQSHALADFFEATVARPATRPRCTASRSGPSTSSCAN